MNFNSEIVDKKRELEMPENNLVQTHTVPNRSLASSPSSNDLTKLDYDEVECKDNLGTQKLLRISKQAS